jgi:6-phosphogluconate dehydrogenase
MPALDAANNNQADIGLIGLAVMGENLALNIESRGYCVAVYNRTPEKTHSFIAGRAAGKAFIAAESLQELVQNLKRPRRVMLMVKAGAPVQNTIGALIPLLEPGDIIIDGGNSNYHDTERRTVDLEKEGLHYVGTGVSGGEEGALKGPAIMPGGAKHAWSVLRPLFEAIAARAPDGSPCCRWMGPGGAGHFVKMVHNGIEYGDMQLIAEAYHIMRDILELPGEAMQTIFEDWNRGDLQSYLIEITAAILAVREKDGELLLERILDAAGEKGTGRWTVAAALDLGVPLTLIGESVFARSLSAFKTERTFASGILSPPVGGPAVADPKTFIADLEKALLASKIISYAQGFALLKAASQAYGWNLDYADIAMVWRNGCIIRSVFLESIAAAFQADPDLSNLVLSPFFQEKLAGAQAGWRRVATTAIQHGLPIPALAAALTYYDGLRCARLPANLLQAQRDFFGAHTYERVDHPRGECFHTEWVDTPPED